MKKVLLVPLIIFILLVSSCCIIPKDNGESDNGDIQNGYADNGNSDSAESLKIEDYFPITENRHMVYEGQGNEFAAYDMFIDYATDTKVQQRVNNGGTIVVSVLEVKDGQLIKILLKPETYYRENMLEKGDQNEVLLREPLVNGTTWTSEDSKVRTITNISADVTTPYGDYKALEVTTTSPNNGTEKFLEYYVKDLGLVKSIFKSGEHASDEIASSLKEITEDAVMKQSIAFYYPNINDDKIYYQVKDVDFKTNDITRNKLEAAYKKDAPWPVLTPNTKINSLYLNEDGMVYIDLSRDFVTEMNAGADYEAMMLQSIVNTFGNYYGVERVLLTIDNQPYSSGHIVLEQGEYLTVNWIETEPLD
ncbi:GerMN domain-containing protein [Acetobacterium bakii]|uniref:Lipoprotein n=1 Tax=Acetobacterium bakii TaxID=52689 RepID=A0A0L6U057_9FIRM|nr:GerMN domain-containing protein [Acetobacterium bakii]KNZ41220.1 lipoprotein [Acetobacterium bakii]